ncbi:MAG: intradiol ring-cleavage dioxygenase [Burkholderiales bacterium]
MIHRHVFLLKGHKLQVIEASTARRQALRHVGEIALASAAVAGGMPLMALAQAYLPTPRQTEGPFYPVKLPADHDSDLVNVKGANGMAKGEVTHLSGRILDAQGRPLQGVRVEIWQADANGRYHHPGDRSGADADPNFQGFGHFVTGADGSYAFRTIKPVPYPGRAPHIHFKLRGANFPEFVTQLYVAGHPGNDRDGLLTSIPQGPRRSSLLANFLPIKAPSGVTEFSARFEIVLGVTPKQA